MPNKCVIDCFIRLREHFRVHSHESEGVAAQLCKSICAAARMEFVGLNDLHSHTEVISTNLILQAKCERGLKIAPVATVTYVAGYGCLVDDDDEEKTKRRMGEEEEIRKKKSTTGGFYSKDAWRD